MKLGVVLKKRDEGGFRAIVPTLPGCTSIAMDETEALQNIRGEILLHLGIEEVPQTKSLKNAAYYQGYLAQMLETNISKDKRLAMATTLTGLLLMFSVIWTAGIFS